MATDTGTYMTVVDGIRTWYDASTGELLGDETTATMTVIGGKRYWTSKATGKLLDHDVGYVATASGGVQESRPIEVDEYGIPLSLYRDDPARAAELQAQKLRNEQRYQQELATKAVSWITVGDYRVKATTSYVPYVSAYQAATGTGAR